MEQLPYELLYEIFTYLPQEELCSTVSKVCRKWKDVVLDSRLWRGKTYCPTNTTTDDEIESLLADVEVIEVFDGHRLSVDTQVVSALCASGTNLTEVILSPNQDLEQGELEILCCTLRNLESLSIHISDDETARLNFVTVGGFHSLKKLTLTGVYNYRRGVLMPLATGCSSLKELNLGCLSSEAVSSPIDIAAILKWKVTQLVSFTFTCQMVSSHLCEIIGRCVQLQALHMNIHQSWVFVDFMCLLDLKNLKEFSVVGCLDRNQTLEDLFAQQEWCYLKYVCLSIGGGCAIDIMFNSCPNVKMLRLEGDNEVQYILRSILRLLNLEELVLAYWASSIDETMLHLSHLKNLKKICFEQCSKLRDVDVLDFTLCNGLEVITFDRCNSILGYNFHHVIGHLKQLKEINFVGCVKLKDDPIAELRTLFPYLSINLKHE